MRLVNYAFDYALFAKFFFSCIFTLFVVFRDTTCVYEFEDDEFVDELCTLNCQRMKRIIEVQFEFFEFWLCTIFVCDWIKFIIWFNLESRYEWIFLILSLWILPCAISWSFAFFVNYFDQFERFNFDICVDFLIRMRIYICIRIWIYRIIDFELIQLIQNVLNLRFIIRIC